MERRAAELAREQERQRELERSLRRREDELARAEERVAVADEELKRGSDKVVGDRVALDRALQRAEAAAVEIEERRVRTEAQERELGELRGKLAQELEAAEARRRELERAIERQGATSTGIDERRGRRPAGACPRARAVRRPRGRARA